MNHQEVSNKVGDKQYELANHLGNVLNVVTDRKLPFVYDSNTSGLVDYFTADVKSYSDYYPFGMQLPNRHDQEGGNYRYGFNGKEKDDEIKSGEGNSYDFGARMFDSRLGRWLTIDPQSGKQPSFSPYKAFLNSPIIFNDPDGEYEFLTVIYKDSKGNVTSKVVSSEAISDKVRAGNLQKHDAGGQRYRNYYDFRTVITITTGADGKTTTEIKYYTLTKFQRAKSMPQGKWIPTAKVGDIVEARLVVEGYKEPWVQDGINFTSKDGGSRQTKVKSKYPVESIDIEDLLIYTGAAGRGAKPGREWVSEGMGWAEFLDRIKGVVEESGAGGNDPRVTPSTEPLKDSIVLEETQYNDPEHKTSSTVYSPISRKDAKSHEGKMNKTGDTLKTIKKY